MPTEPPGFLLSAPSTWSSLSPDGPSPVDGWVSQFLKFQACIDGERLRADLRDLWASLPRVGIRRVFTWARASETAAALLVVTVSVLPAPSRANHEALRDVLDSLGQLEMSSCKLETRPALDGVMLRAERLIQERNRLPWESSREIRYAYPHPTREVAAIIVATSPNINDDALFACFDLMASTFRWNS